MIEAIRPSIAMTVDDGTMVGEARRRANALADQLGFDETRRGKIALTVTESANNLLKHAGRGQLILQARASEGAEGRLDVLALDQGPGMGDVGRCFSDGFSTAGSLGNGLGAIARLADDYAIHSAPGSGTVLWARFGTGRPLLGDGTTMEIGVVSVAVAGESACGDEWAVLDRDGSILVLVVDGLGHGPAAAEAAAEAVAVLRALSTSDPGEIVAAAHVALRGTRGAALAVARLDPLTCRVYYAGVGNISGVIIDRRGGRISSMVSQNGTVGHAVRKVQIFEYNWPDGSAIVMQSDGIGARWDLGQYPGLSLRHPSLIAGILYRDHRRDRDDATVVVASRKDATS